ncbi:hypothetical protein [Cedecea sp.]|jgi:hypothetical protein|uniref:hypothetical protein n=1 Tax=Cedecea sp. TaxID=1970739 RepID=UPI0012AE2E12|nr:hypothetical protein [Enterobacteriaceae bacterium RIT693]
MFYDLPQTPENHAFRVFVINLKAENPLCFFVIRKSPLYARRAFSRAQDEIFSINPVNGMCHLTLSSWINDLVSGP